MSQTSVGRKIFHYGINVFLTPFSSHLSFVQNVLPSSKECLLSAIASELLNPRPDVVALLFCATFMYVGCLVSYMCRSDYSGYINILL